MCANNDDVAYHNRSASNLDFAYHDRRADGISLPEPGLRRRNYGRWREHRVLPKHNCTYLSRRTILPRAPNNLRLVRRRLSYESPPASSDPRVESRACRTINYSDVHNIDDLHNKLRFRSSSSLQEAKTACLGTTLEPSIRGGSRGTLKGRKDPQIPVCWR